MDKNEADNDSKQGSRSRRSRSTKKEVPVKGKTNKRKGSTDNEEEIENKKVPAKNKPKKRKISIEDSKEVAAPQDLSSGKTSKSKRKSQSITLGLKKQKKITETAMEENTNDSKKTGADLTFGELKRLALKRYESLLVLDETKTCTIHITTSSLGDEDQKIVKLFCSKLSSKSGMYYWIIG